jgi:hypothetical protein
VKGVQIDKTIFYNTLEHLWPMCVFGLGNHDLKIYILKNIIVILCDKKDGVIMYMMYD